MTKAGDLEEVDDDFEDVDDDKEETKTNEVSSKGNNANKNMFGNLNSGVQAKKMDME